MPLNTGSTVVCFYDGSKAPLAYFFLFRDIGPSKIRYILKVTFFKRFDVDKRDFESHDGLQKIIKKAPKTRLAYKSSLESAKRDRQSSSERARSASERELDLFLLLEIESSDVILARTFQGVKLSTQCILVISTHLWKRRQLHWKTFSMRFKTLGMFPNKTEIR